MSNFEPDETVSDPPPYVLHPLRGAVWAAFWGTPVAAGIVMAINYWRIGRKAAARNIIIFGVFATAALFGMMFLIPEDILDRIPSVVFVAPQLILVSVFVKSLQQDFIDRHVMNGGRMASAWRSVGIGLLCLPVTLIALFGAAFILEPSFGTVANFGNDEVYYAGDATENDARKLADVLNELGFFGSTGASVRLESLSGRSTVSFVLVENAWSEPETVGGFRGIGQSIIASGFPTPLTIQLCDDYFSAKNTIIIE